MTRRILCFALSALSAPCALAQSGVLIGVSKPGGYETLWVIRDSSQPLRATIPDLLVPRADGWWRLGTVSICSTGGPEGQWMDVLWRARADSTPTISEFCHEVPRSELPVPIHADDSAAADSLGRELVRCSWSRISVKFVSPEYVAVGETSGQTEACEPRGERSYQTYYVSRFHGDSSLSLARFAGSGIDSVGRIAFGRAARDLSRDEMCSEVVANFDPAEIFEVGNEWYPSRANGRWVPVLFNQIATGHCQLEPVVGVALTSSLTGRDSLQPPWTVLAKRMPGLLDAFASPRGDLVIARVPGSLVVYLVTRQQLGRRIGAVPFTEREIVMIQWATGRDVARWDREIVAMMRRGLGGPKVVSPPKEP